MENQDETPLRRINYEIKLIIITPDFIKSQRDLFFQILGMNYQDLNLKQKSYIDCLLWIDPNDLLKLKRSKMLLIKCIRNPTFIFETIRVNGEYQTFQKLFIDVNTIKSEQPDIETISEDDAGHGEVNLDNVSETETEVVSTSNTNQAKNFADRFNLWREKMIANYENTTRKIQEKPEINWMLVSVFVAILVSVGAIAKNVKILEVKQQMQIQDTTDKSN